MSRGRQQPGSRKSWKRGTLVGQQPVQSKRGLRWFLTVAVLGLIGFFVWALWFDPWGERPFVHLAIRRYERLKIPQIPFVAETLNALREPSQVDKQLISHDFTHLQKAEDLTNLGRDLQSLARNSSKVLIVYVNGHGVSEGGKPFLACSDYLASQGTDGKVPIRSILRSVSETKSQLKLLILDAQSVGHDPRLGVVADEFGLLVADEVGELSKESNTWVLLSCGTLETTSVAYGQNLSLFGLAVKEGLSKLADVDQADNFVTLFEFARHIERRCSSWFGADIGVTQTPVLLKSGTVGAAKLTKSEHGEKPFNLAYVKPKSEPKSDSNSSDSPPAKAPQETPSDKKTTTARTSMPRRWLFDAHPTLAAFQPDPKKGNATSGSGGTDASKSTTQPETAKSNLNSDASGAGASAPAGGAAGSAATSNPTGSPPAGSAGTDPTSKDATSKNTKSKDASTSEKGPPAAKGTEPPTTAATKGTAAATKLTSLTGPMSDVNKTWQLRDELLSLRASGGASVIEVAPAAWRELEYTLLWLERQIRSGQNPEVNDPNRPFTSAQDTELRELVSDMTELKSVMGSLRPAKSRAEDVRVGTRLLRAWNAYIEKRQVEDQKYDQTSRLELRGAKAAWLQLRQMTYRAPYYVRTVAALGLTSEQGSTAHSNVDNYLDELAAAHRALVALRSTSGPLEDTQKLAAFVATVEKLDERRQMIEKQLVTEMSTGLEQINSPTARRRLEDLLTTPLLDAAARQSIMSRLVDSMPLPEIQTLKALPRPDGLIASAARWRRAFERLQLEKKLVDLIDPLSGDRIKSQLGTLEQQVNNVGSSDQLKHREIWKSFQSAAETLQKCYTGITSNLKDETLLLIDPRDAQHDSLRAGRYPIPEFRLELLTPPKLELQVLADDRTALPRGAARKVEVQLVATQKWMLDVPVTPGFQERAISVREVDAGTIESRDGKFTRRITYEVSAKVDQSKFGVESTPLSFKVNWSSGGESKEESKSLAIVLPLPNRIDLEIVRSGGGGTRYAESNSGKKDEVAQEASFLVSLYANRRTTYQLQLVNRSGRAQTLKADLYRVRAATTGGQIAGRISDSARNAVLDRTTKIIDADLIATTAAPVNLTPDAIQSEVLKLAPPGAAPAAPAAPAAGAAPPPPPPATPTPEIDVGRGLLLVLSSTENKNERWYKWIELSPLEPSAYVEPIVGYDQKTQRIMVTVRRRRDTTSSDGQRIPFPTDAPIPVFWDTSTADLPDGNKQPEDQLDANKDAVLFASVLPDNLDRTIHLSVDNYPRAFAFRVSCRDGTPPRFIPAAAVRRTAMPIRIVSLTVTKQGREYLIPPYVYPNLPPPADPTKAPPPPIELPEGVPAVFRAPCDPILVKLQADLPIGFADAQEQIHIALAAAPDRVQKFLMDRHFAPRVKRFGEQGEIEFVTDVRDHEVFVSPGALQDQQTHIEARAILSGDREVTAVVPIKLDSLKPGLRLSNIPRPILKDSKPMLQFVAADLTGVSQLEYAISPNDLTVFPRDGVKTLPVNSDPRNTRHDISLPFDTKGLEPGRYTLLTRATDMVGNIGDVVPVILNIEVPKVAPKKNDGVISGIVKLDGQFPIIPSFFSVEISGPEPRTVKKLKPDGSFEETGLPYGMYTIKAKGTLSDAKEAVGEKMVEPSPPNGVKQVTISVSRKTTP